MNSDDAIILGDINAHSPLWHSKLPCDSRGSKLSEEIEASSYIVLNEKCHTGITSTCKSSPDITLQPQPGDEHKLENRKSAGL